MIVNVNPLASEFDTTNSVLKTSALASEINVQAPTVQPLPDQQAHDSEMSPKHRTPVPAGMAGYDPGSQTVAAADGN